MNIKSLINSSFNSGFGFRFIKPKIFLIGFNKCGTTSLHFFFRDQGLKSAHWMLGKKFLALEAERNRDLVNCRKLFSGYQVFSDFTFLTETEFKEPLDLYPIWREAFPNAYFILNDRPVDEWIDSRLNHRNGKFIERYKTYSGLSESEIVNQWRDKFLTHQKNVMIFFRSDPKFCHFTLGRDHIMKITNLVKADYSLDANNFIRRNSRK